MTKVDQLALKRLAELVKKLAVVHGRVTLSSGKEADYYVDLRRATLHHEASANCCANSPAIGTTPMSEDSPSAQTQ